MKSPTASAAGKRVSGLRQKIEAARKNSEQARHRARQAKVELKAARKAFKEAKRFAKDARKIFKTLKKSAAQPAPTVAMKPRAAVPLKKSRPSRPSRRSAAKVKSPPPEAIVPQELPSTALSLDQQSSPGATLGSVSTLPPPAV